LVSGRRSREVAAQVGRVPRTREKLVPKGMITIANEGRRTFEKVVYLTYLQNGPVTFD